MDKVKITKTVLDALALPAKVEILRDAELQGFGVRITPGGAKSFVVERKLMGKTVRHTIGRVGPWTVQQARAEALQVLAQMERGVNPNDAPEPVPEMAPADNLTVRAVFDAYLAERASTRPAMKPQTRLNYRKVVGLCFGDWMDKPFYAITPAMIVERMAELTKRGATTANNAFRCLRALLNWTIDNEAYMSTDGLSLLQVNPVSVLNRRRLWNKNRRLTSRVEFDDLPKWWAAVDQVLQNDWPGRADVMRDYWRLMLFTGMRPGEAARIEIGGWNPKLREISIADPKNREDSFVLPLGDYAAGIVAARAAISRAEKSPWLFPAPRRDAGHTSSGHEIRQAMCIASGIKWTFTDLRRTFASHVDRLEVSSYMLKRVMGHKSKDVTGGYVQHDREQVRAVMQRVEDAILRAAKVR